MSAGSSSSSSATSEAQCTWPVLRETYAAFSIGSALTQSKPAWRSSKRAAGADITTMTVEVGAQPRASAAGHSTSAGAKGVRPAWARIYGLQAPCGGTDLDSSCARITTSRRQGQDREGLSGASPSARGARRRTETADKAEGREASWHMAAKPTGTQPTVNAALMGERAPTPNVHRQFALLTWGDLRRGRCADDEEPGIGRHRETKVQALRRAARCRR